MLVFSLIVCALIWFVWFIWRITSNSTDHSQTQQQLADKLYGDGEYIVETLKKETAKIEAYIQADIVGDQRTVDAIKSDTYKGPYPEKRDDGGWLSIYDELRILKIAGINHRKGIGQYTGRVECALVPEPSNEFDPNAIKIVAEDSHHLGYIPTDQTDFVRSLAANEFPYRCTAFINECEDEMDGHKFFVGHVYIKRLD